MTKICCAHGCKSNTKNSPSLKFYNLTTARGTLSEWLQAFPFRYRLDILAEVNIGKESTYNICEVHFSKLSNQYFSQKAPEPRVIIKERRTRWTQTDKSLLKTKLKISPVEIVDVQPDPLLMQPATVNNVQMQPVTNSHIPAFLGGVQPCNRDIGTLGGFVTNMNAVQQSQGNAAGYITINGTQLITDNVANMNFAQTQCTNIARFGINTAQLGLKNVNPGFFMNPPRKIPIIRPRLEIGLANRSCAPAPIKIRPKPEEIRVRRPRILTNITPTVIPGFITVNALQPNVQLTETAGIPGYAANKLIKPNINNNSPGFVATDNIQPIVDTTKAETINNAWHSNDPVIENVQPIKVENYTIKIEDDGIRQMDTNNDNNISAELKITDTDQGESDLIKIEFPTDENAEHLVKFEVEESNDDAESYYYFEGSGAKRRKSESDNDFKMVQFKIYTDHDYT